MTAARPMLLRASHSCSSVLAATAAFRRGPSSRLVGPIAPEARSMPAVTARALAPSGSLGDSVGEQSAQGLLAGDQELPLVGEVPEEGTRGDAGAPGDLRHRGGVASLLDDR